MTLRTLARPVLLAGALLASWSCGGSEGPTGPDPSVVTSVTVTPTTATVDVGQTVQLSATALNGLEETVSTTVSWSSADPGVATVSSSGLVTGVAEGSATITASAGGQSGSATVTVVDPTPPDAPAGLTVTAASHTEVELTWTDASDNEDGFEIEREPVSQAGATGTEGQTAAFEQVTTVGVGVTSFTDTDLDPATAYRYRVRAINANGASDYTAAAEVSTHATLVMETEALPDGTLDTAYEVAMAASGGGGEGTFAWSLTGGAFPADLSLSAEGVVSGTPTETGTSTVEITVASGGQTVVRSFELTVRDELVAPVVVTTTLPEASVGVAYSETLEASGGDGLYAWTLVSGSLPEGLSLAEDGTVSGTPTTEGSATVTVQVESAGLTGSGQVDITVTSRPLEVTTSTLPDGQVGSGYEATLASSGGVPPVVWSLESGSLPDGVGLSQDGTLSGTPTAAGTWEFVVKATSDDGQEATAALSLTIAPGPVSIVTGDLDGGQVGTAYSLDFQAVGGDGTDYAWSLAVGTAPPGLTLDASGTLSGIPGSEGTFSFSVRATSGGNSRTKSMILTTIPQPQPGYQVELVYLTTVSASVRAVFEASKDRWSELITGDEPDEPGGIPRCSTFHPATQATVDDVVIYVVVEDIDGEGGTLGRASPCWLRDVGFKPVTGAMTFDRADLNALQTNDLLDDVILHEMGHVLGIGVGWDNLDLLQGQCTEDPIFIGERTIAAFNDAEGDIFYDGEPVPVENGGVVADGSNCSHWRESVFDDELMSPFLNSGDNPLSSITVESLADMGYTVDPSVADGYTIPPFVPGAAAVSGRGVPLVDDLLPIVPRKLDPAARGVGGPR